MDWPAAATLAARLRLVELAEAAVGPSLLDARRRQQQPCAELPGALGRPAGCGQLRGQVALVHPRLLEVDAGILPERRGEPA
jgi:hypothetical protein